MKYLHRYHDFESFIKDYGNDDPNIGYIVVSGITLNFMNYEPEDNWCEWKSDDEYWADTYVGRNPSVGDTAMLYPPEASEGIETTIEEVEDKSSGYIEPWVSFCDESIVTEFILDCNCGHDPGYFYGARFDRKIEDGVYHWDCFQLPGRPAPAYTYITPTANPQGGDPVYGSIAGMSQGNSLGCVAEITKRYNKVTYNNDWNLNKRIWSQSIGSTHVNVAKMSLSVEQGCKSPVTNTENSKRKKNCCKLFKNIYIFPVNIHYNKACKS